MRDVRHSGCKSRGEEKLVWINRESPSPILDSVEIRGFGKNVGKIVNSSPFLNHHFGSEEKEMERGMFVCIYIYIWPWGFVCIVAGLFLF